MNALPQRYPLRCPRRDAAEDRAWRGLYRDAANPVVAAEIVRHLDEDAKRTHLALYLRCRRTLRKRAARKLFAARAASLLRRIHRSVMRLFQFDPISRVLRQGPGVAPRLSPQASAVARVDRHTSETREFAANGLRVIEVAAERANVVQLRAYLDCVRLQLLALEGDQRESAQALLLKLERLLDDQRVEPLVRVMVRWPTGDTRAGAKDERQRCAESPAATA